MRDRDSKNNLGTKKLPDPETSHDLMAYELDYYIKHHRVVLQKLRYAQQATMQSLKEIKDICQRFAIDSSVKEFSEIEKYDHTWKEIIGLFEGAGMSEQELSGIESMLHSIPEAIRQNYEILVSQDKTLQAMIALMDSEEYRNVCEAIRNVQHLPNPMSGLGPEDYEIELPESESPVSIMRIVPQRQGRHRKIH